jgi:hypothetical protein
MPTSTRATPQAANGVGLNPVNARTAATGTVVVVGGTVVVVLIGRVVVETARVVVVSGNVLVGALVIVTIRGDVVVVLSDVATKTFSALVTLVVEVGSEDGWPVLARRPCGCLRGTPLPEVVVVGATVVVVAGRVVVVGAAVDGVGCVVVLLATSAEVVVTM